MKRRIIVALILDLGILILSFLFMVWWKPGSMNYLSPRYLTGFAVLLLSWILFSVLFKKYIVEYKKSLGKNLQKILLANLAAASAIAVAIIATELSGYSRMVFFGTVGFSTIAELVIGYFYYMLIHTKNGATDLYDPPPSTQDIRKANRAVNYRDIALSADFVREAVISECGNNACDFINKHSDFADPQALFISTNTRFNVQFQPDEYFRQVINLRKINDIQYINKFFETVNRKLPMKGTFIGFAETKEQRKKRILRKYPPVLNQVMYFIDFVVKRIFPKFSLTKKIYFFLTRGLNRVISRAEVLGRLYSCGFHVVEERNIDNYFYFVVQKNDEPAYDMNPTYGPFIKLRRVGKNGKLIKVYKFRTMHPYAEYLQEYVYNMQDLKDGGKFNDDFRISGFGKFMRALWIDELPMIFNLLKGDMKLVGVRPLSNHYYSLYSEELQNQRIRFRPGLVPPFYADMPKTLEEIQESELKYLREYEKAPLRTDWRYFWLAVGNILLKKARSG